MISGPDIDNLPEISGEQMAFLIERVWYCLPHHDRHFEYGERGHR